MEEILTPIGRRDETKALVTHQPFDRSLHRRHVISSKPWVSSGPPDPSLDNDGAPLTLTQAPPKSGGTRRTASTGQDPTPIDRSHAPWGDRTAGTPRRQ